MKRVLERFVPLGVEAGREVRWAAGGLTASALFGFLCFIVGYVSARGQLFRRLPNGEKELIEGALMSSFRDVVGISFAGFAVLAAAMLYLAAYHYAYHRIGSRSIYLMRRLPDRLELHRRCLALPVAVIVLCAAVSFILLCIFYWIYIAMTPEQCLVPGQWRMFWR